MDFSWQIFNAPIFSVSHTIGCLGKWLEWFLAHLCQSELSCCRVCEFDDSTSGRRDHSLCKPMVWLKKCLSQGFVIFGVVPRTKKRNYAEDSRLTPTKSTLLWCFIVPFSRLKESAGKNYAMRFGERLSGLR